MKLRRTGAFVASVTLAVTGLAMIPAPAQAATDARPSEIGADWLAGELVDGLIPSQFAGFPDYGLTIDTAFALASVGGHAADIEAIADALGPKVADGYAIADEYDFVAPFDFKQKGFYAGSIAKSLVFASVASVSDVPAWSGRDLVADLEGLVSAQPDTVGRIVDDSFYGDYANVIGQSFAANALDIAGSSEAADVRAFLLQQQCSAGYFRLYMTPDKNAADQTCNGGRASGESAPDPDATAYAILNLSNQLDDPAVARAIGKAEAWLLSRQNADGSFNGGTSTDVPNANTTGLVGTTLGQLGNDEEALQAAYWVRGRQADEVAACSNELSTETGAIGYDPATVTAATTAGIADAARPQWRRATAGSLPVLKLLPAVSATLDLTGPTGYVRAGGGVALKVTGAVPGEKLCVSGTAGKVRGVAGANGAATLTAKVSAGTANRTYVVTNQGGGTDQTVVKALGAKTFTVTLSKKTAERGTLVRVRATGLAPGEKLRLVFRGVTLRSSAANANGVYATEFNVRRTLGKGTVVVAGQFTGRRGSATLTVVR